MQHQRQHVELLEILVSCALGVVVDLMIAPIGIFFNGIYDFYDMDGRMACNGGTSW
jgi:hypothetical protein